MKKQQIYKSRLDFNKQTGRIMIFDAGCSYSGMSASEKKNIETLVPSSANSKENFASALRETTAPAKVMPKESDVMNAPFRLLSATIVGGGSYKATDFTNEAVLRDSMPLLKGVTVYTDHYAYCVENWLGVVSAVSWTPSYEQNGTTIPAGIDGVISIDISDDRGAKIARGILMGAVHSNSVSVEFDWVPSHSFNSTGGYDGMYEFYERLGSIGADGKMVRRIVTAITCYYESSIVTMGADPYAKKIDAQGNITNIDTAAIVSLAKGNFENTDAAVKSGVLAKYSVQTDSDFRSEMVDFTNNKFTAAKKEVMKMSKFSETVNAAIETVIAGKHYANKTAVLEKMALDCNCSLRQVQNYLNGTTPCPPQASLVAMAKVLYLAQTDLIAACEGDGCTYTAPTATGAGETVIPIVFDKTDASCDEEEEEEEEMKKKDMEDEDEDEMTAALEKSNAKYLMLEAKYTASAQALAKSTFALMEKDKEIANLLVAAEIANANALVLSDSQINLQAATTKTTELALQVTEAKKTVAELQSVIDSYKKEDLYFNLGKATFEANRKEAINFYKKASGGNVQPATLALMETTTDIEFLNGMVAQFGAELGKQMSYTCKGCGSNDFKFGSVVSHKYPDSVVSKSEVKTESEMQQAFPTKQVLNRK